MPIAKTDELKTLFWIAVNAPIETFKNRKSLARYVSKIIGFDVSVERIRYIFDIFGMSAKQLRNKEGIEHAQFVALFYLWGMV